MLRAAIRFRLAFAGELFVLIMVPTIAKIVPTIRAMPGSPMTNEIPGLGNAPAVIKVINVKVMIP
jgi:hypothetical protein